MTSQFIINVLMLLSEETQGRHSESRHCLYFRVYRNLQATSHLMSDLVEVLTSENNTD